jgi:hypothetical protein
MFQRAMRPSEGTPREMEAGRDSFLQTAVLDWGLRIGRHGPVDEGGRHDVRQGDGGGLWRVSGALGTLEPM